MKYLLAQVYHKVAFTLALLAAGLSIGWSWRQQAIIRGLHRELIRPVLSGLAYTPAQWPLPQASLNLWSNPPAQSRGSDWLYEVFSPPTITYNQVAQQFAVVSPHSPAKPLATRPGLQLLAVKAEPYRLQLVGYFGKPDDYHAVFACPLSSETILVRPGHRFESLGLTLKSFEVCKITLESDVPGPVYEVAALAVLHDEKNDAEVVLDSRFRMLTDTPLAVFNTPGETEGARVLHEGDTISCDEDSYRVERIQLEPAEVVVARTSRGLSVPEMRVMRPVGQVSGTGSMQKSRSPKAATDVAASNP